LTSQLQFYHYPQIVGARSLDPQHLTNRNGTLYFVGNSETQGRELWKSNGTTAALP
jgi:hypothetical protein